MNKPHSYQVRSPLGQGAGQSYPALLCMHGMGSDERSILSVVDGMESASYFFGIRGHLLQPPGFAYFAIEGYGKPHRHSFDEAVARLCATIYDIVNKYPIDPNRVFLAGFSQGAILAMTLGLMLGSRIRGLAALSGYIPGFVTDDYSPQSLHGMSVFIAHGTTDPVFPVQWADRNADVFRSGGADVTQCVYDHGHCVSEETRTDLIRWYEIQMGEAGEH